MLWGAAEWLKHATHVLQVGGRGGGERALSKVTWGQRCQPLVGDQRRSPQLCLEIQKDFLEEVAFELGPVLPGRQKEEHGRSRAASGRIRGQQRRAGGGNCTSQGPPLGQRHPSFPGDSPLSVHEVVHVAYPTVLRSDVPVMSFVTAVPSPGPGRSQIALQGWPMSQGRLGTLPWWGLHVSITALGSGRRLPTTPGTEQRAQGWPGGVCALRRCACVCPCTRGFGDVCSASRWPLARVGKCGDLGQIQGDGDGGAGAASRGPKDGLGHGWGGPGLNCGALGLGACPQRACPVRACCVCTAARPGTEALSAGTREGGAGREGGNSRPGAWWGGSAEGQRAPPPPCPPPCPRARTGLMGRSVRHLWDELSISKASRLSSERKCQTKLRQPRPPPPRPFHCPALLSTLPTAATEAPPPQPPERRSLWVSGVLLTWKWARPHRGEPSPPSPHHQCLPTPSSFCVKPLLTPSTGGGVTQRAREDPTLPQANAVLGGDTQQGHLRLQPPRAWPPARREERSGRMEGRAPALGCAWDGRPPHPLI